MIFLIDKFNGVIFIITEFLISIFLSFGTFLFSLFPDFAQFLDLDVSVLQGILSYATYFFPLDLWVVCIGNISFWFSSMLLWSVIEFLYKKIPFID
ncbi:hypothetical protein AN642_00705 [Epulopiscium sp. SCG-B10WGA-EpuloA2]|nr:hypothetical protein AN642_00705 [Epulopiscium sp. SCG-B10WGA-EpuloA2]